MEEEFKEAWKVEKENHLGDYGDSLEYDLYCAFKAGFYAAYGMIANRLSEEHKEEKAL